MAARLIPENSEDHEGVPRGRRHALMMAKTNLSDLITSKRYI
jgi:hypothetical protein